MSTQSRCWCFTFNNYTDDDVESLKNCELFQYCIFGKEVGDSGTPHLQGYFELPTKRTLKGLKKVLLAYDERFTFHLEIRMGSQEQAIEYCMKESDDITEWGTKIKPGRRTDLDLARRIAYDYGMAEVVARCSLQSIKVAEKFLEYNEEKRKLKAPPLVIWIWGPSGSGKTELSKKLSKNYNKYVWNPTATGRWWNGYDRHELVIMNEFRLTSTKEGFLLDLLDKHPLTVEVKGSSRQMLADKFIINQMMAPESFWESKESVEQLRRRITVEVKIGADHNYDIVWVNPNIEDVIASITTCNDFLENLLLLAIGHGGNTVPMTFDDWNDVDEVNEDL